VLDGGLTGTADKFLRLGRIGHVIEREREPERVKVLRVLTRAQLKEPR